MIERTPHAGNAEPLQRVSGADADTSPWTPHASAIWLGPRLWLFGVLAASILLFSKLAEDVAGHEWIVSLDRAVAASLHAQTTGLGAGVFTVVTYLGSALVLVPVTVLAILTLVRCARRAHAVFMGAALAGGEALNTTLKLAFGRPRPSFADPLATAAGFSFPSGHAMVSIVVYGALAFVASAAVRSRWAKGLVVLSALVLILAIGFSRIYLGVHYPSDVLAGYSAGLAWLMVCALTALDASRRSRRPAEAPRGSRFRPTTQPHPADPPVGCESGDPRDYGLGSSTHTSAPPSR